jgi:hypothetical protein
LGATLIPRAHARGNGEAWNEYNNQATMATMVYMQITTCLSILQVEMFEYFALV